MARGKQTCKILKEIRRQIAEANGIEFATSECRYKGDCLGTCPKCEAEVRYLEQQLRARSLTGKAVALAGISAASLAMLMPMKADAQSPIEIKTVPAERTSTTCVSASKVKGVVKCLQPTEVDSLATEAIPSATVLNLTNFNGVATDLDGNFELYACVGDTLKVSYVGFSSKTITVKDLSEPITVIMEEYSDLDGVIVVGAYGPQKPPKGTLDLNIIDEKGNRIDRLDVDIDRLYIDENGNEAAIHLDPIYVGDDDEIRFHWNSDWDLQDEDGVPLKEAIFRITVDGYDDPVTIKVKQPKRKARKTIKFKHKKK
ncbi:MAG: carboxypeptidase-like regulatory domain-containing protein [Muribaculaceae bacterium]|nr:carboxypeptidase-like regulatory domain-containing protein [Muribaculaceae bacterium]